MIETCKLNTVDAHAWLVVTVTAIVGGQKQSQHVVVDGYHLCLAFLADINWCLRSSRMACLMAVPEGRLPEPMRLS